MRHRNKISGLTSLKNEEGLATLEAVFLLVWTLFIMFYLMGFGFIHYQRWTVTHVANDTAVRIAQSYAYPESDPVMGYISPEMKKKHNPYRYLGTELEKTNRDKARDYAYWTLELSRLAFPEGVPDVKTEIVHDALGQRHVKVKVSADYRLLFGDFLSFFGFERTFHYDAVGYAVVTDISSYIFTVNNLKTLSDEMFTTKISKTIDAILNTINKFIDLMKK